MGLEARVPPRKDMGPEVGKGPGTRDWGTVPQVWIDRVKKITFPRTTYARGNKTTHTQQTRFPD